MSTVLVFSLLSYTPPVEPRTEEKAEEFTVTFLECGRLDHPNLATSRLVSLGELVLEMWYNDHSSVMHC